ncbi:hypothetical protein [Streptomyces sp. NPDC057363]|uniref:hypothetical protein n=1 Tax=Streptomyces sp. NPDC057363 TaxID=3346107 RepID=UPI00363A9AC3
MSIPEGSKKTRYTLTLPREVVDKIFWLAEHPGSLYLHEKPYKSAASLNIEIWHEGAVYGVTLELDGSKAEVSSYWGSSQLQVIGNNLADEEQLAALVSRWKVGQ